MNLHASIFSLLAAFHTSVFLRHVGIDFFAVFIDPKINWLPRKTSLEPIKGICLRLFEWQKVAARLYSLFATAVHRFFKPWPHPRPSF